MKIPLYIVDAFTNKLFSGNPAAICPLDHFLDDDTLQKIAMENNLSETAFFIKTEDKFEIRWFTPGTEVDLCGHATLAAAYVLFNQLNYQGPIINFYSKRSGDLMVTKNGNMLTLNFPSDIFNEVAIEPNFKNCLNIQPTKVFKGKTDLMFVYENEHQITHIIPNFIEITSLGGRGLIVTAKGNEVDFVSRCFFPQSGVNEDPVTGSAHTTLIPYWSKQLNKTSLTAKQLSERGGSLFCEYLGDRVNISGEGMLYLIGEIQHI
ncbi:MAG: PhzF family phenazine biosynthesis protein [Bacteroidetes bacterium]|nr:PhzF family phenazine biosynthesis protein [Bacteroidota bacterium]